MYRFTTILFFLLLFIIESTSAQISIDGFYRNFNAVTTKKNPEYLVGRNRIELNLSKDLSDGRIFISTQILNTYSDSLEKLDFRIREAYFEFYRGNYDIRIGQQQIPYGESTVFFLNDILNPIDVSEFLTQELRDIRLGIPALKVTRYLQSDYLELVFTPFFNSYVFPKPDSPFFPFENISTLGNFPVLYENSLNQVTEASPQVALRYAWNRNLKIDMDFYAMYWYNPNAAFRKDLAQISILGITIPVAQLQLESQYLQSVVFGHSGNYIVSDNLILKSEVVYFQRRLFDYFTQDLSTLLTSPPTIQRTLDLFQDFQENEDGFLLERPYSVQMLGAQFNTLGWTIETQFVNEYIFNYNSRILQDEYFTSATLLLQKQFLRDKLGFRLFNRYNLSGSDFWINPEFNYDFSDGLVFQAGSQVFGGNNPDSFYGHFSFENYSDITFGYLRLTAYF